VPIEKADLILHPARMQILIALTGQELSTRDLSTRLEGIVPQSSIYRHMRVLLENGLIEIASSRMVKGVQEKTYRLAQSPHISQEDLANARQEDHLRYFAMYLASQLQGFAAYLQHHPRPDFQTDGVGYTQSVLTVTSGELQAVFEAIRNSIKSAAENTISGGDDLKPGAHRHVLAFITYPFENGDTNHGKLP
jgi:DNA-binding transcriptional ArsR family regulator